MTPVALQVRAFSLIEVAVASVIAGIISVAAIGSFAVLNRLLVRVQNETQASDNAKTLVDFLVTDLQGVGGGPVQPFMAIDIDNGAAGKPDIITYGILVPGSTPCTIVANTNSSVTGEGTDAGCCLNAVLSGAAGFSVNPASSTHTHAMVGLVDGELNASVVLVGLDSATCTAPFVAGPLSDTNRIQSGADLRGGTVSPMIVRTLVLNTTAHELLALSKRQNFDRHQVEPGDVVEVLATHVFDLQAQLGFDGDPSDGRLRDSGDATDEWLYNTPVPTVDTVAATIVRPDVRMVGVGVVIGVKQNDRALSNSAQVVGGPVYTVVGEHLRAAMGRAGLRNLAVVF